MRIALHSNQFDGRGSGKSCFDYAQMLKQAGHEIVLVTSKSGDNEGLRAIGSLYPSIQYTGNANNIGERSLVKLNLQEIVASEHIDFMYMLKWGVNDNVTPTNCKIGIHSVFEMTEPHGDVYAGVSEYIALKYNQSLYVPPIVRPFPQTDDIRLKYNIPKDATVIGRHGGRTTFNVSFVHQAVRDILNYRNDIYFVFLSTEKFIDHPRVVFIPWVETEQEKFNIIHSCDVMLHARLDGETFGVAVGEFSCCNKPVITWSGKSNGVIIPGYDTSHLDLLGKKAIIFNEYKELLDILYSIKREDTIPRLWDVYSDRFCEAKIFKQFNTVFLKSN